MIRKSVAFSREPPKRRPSSQRRLLPRQSKKEVKPSPESAAKGILDGLEPRQEDMFPDPAPQSIADVRNQVMLSLATDFENFNVFKPQPRNEKSVNDMLDQVIAWGSALKTL